MSERDAVLKAIRNAIEDLPPELEEAVNELAEFIEMHIERAGPIVGHLALALVGAKLEARDE